MHVLAWRSLALTKSQTGNMMCECCKLQQECAPATRGADGHDVRVATKCHATCLIWYLGTESEYDIVRIDRQLKQGTAYTVSAPATKPSLLHLEWRMKNASLPSAYLKWPHSATAHCAAGRKTTFTPSCVTTVQHSLTLSGASTQVSAPQMQIALATGDSV